MLRGKDASLSNAKSLKACHPYLMDFLEIFTYGSYDRDMKILKILASNSKQVRVYGIFKKSQIDDDKGGGHQIQQVFR